MRLTITVSGVVLLLSGASCARRTATITIDAPDEVKAELDAGVPADAYTLYALATAPPENWEAVRSAGVTVCDCRPPLLPGEMVSLLDRGGFLPGTMVGLSTDNFEEATKGRVRSTLDTKLHISVGVTLNGCASGAIEHMEQVPGHLLLAERGADFDGKDRLVEVRFN